MWFKAKAPVLGDFEQLVLLGVLRLERHDSPTEPPSDRKFTPARGRDVYINAAYTTLSPRYQTASKADWS